MKPQQFVHISIAMMLSAAVWYGVDATISERTGLSIFALVAWLWISEALNISVTALLIPVLALATGLLPAKQAFANFASPVIFLFMGGFALAAALQKYTLDKAFAARMLSLSRGNPLGAILLLFLVTALLSMWISNTATVAMIIPLALGLLSGRDSKTEAPLFIFVLLGVAYSGNLGGMATLIGSPPNAIAASAAGLSFREWLNWGVPMFLLLFPIAIGTLYLLLRPRFGTELTLEHQYQPMHWQRYTVIFIFFATALGWVLSAPLSEWLGVARGFDSMIAVVAIVLLTGSGCLKFEEFVAKTNWGILILFGGGLTLSSLLQVSGGSAWLASGFTDQLPADNPWLLLVIVCLFVVFLTELVSNTASAALLVPLFISVAANLNLSETGIAVVIALCASCAFMLPVATPPNAIVFASGFVPQRRMMQVGLVLNISIALVIASIGWGFME